MNWTVKHSYQPEAQKAEENRQINANELDLVSLPAFLFLLMDVIEMVKRW